MKYIKILISTYLKNEEFNSTNFFEKKLKFLLHTLYSIMLLSNLLNFLNFNILNCKQLYFIFFFQI